MIERHRNQRHEPATISLMVYQCEVPKSHELSLPVLLEDVNTGIVAMSMPVRTQLFTILATYV